MSSATRGAEPALRDRRAVHHDRLRGHAWRGRGFSLIELLTVLGVAVILTGLMFPVLSQVRENVNRVVCGSNMRQLGLSFTMFARDNNDWLPRSELLREDHAYQELMAANIGGKGEVLGGMRTGMRGYDENGWDGIGMLYSRGYCSSPECFYCPSHTGEHSLARYEQEWFYPTGARIYTNYHYCGDVFWEDHSKRRRLEEGDDLVLAVDGLRTRADFNHVTGLNLLYGDGSVRWFEDAVGIHDRLPDETSAAEAPEDGYRRIWGDLEGRNKP